MRYEYNCSNKECKYYVTKFERLYVKIPTKDDTVCPECNSKAVKLVSLTGKGIVK